MIKKIQTALENHIGVALITVFVLMGVFTTWLDF